MYFIALIQKNKNIYLKYSNTLKNAENILSSENTFIKLNRNNTGNDVRFNLNYSINSEELELYKINILFEKKKLLEILEKEDFSIFNKLDMIKKEFIKPMNLTAGGLWKDWENE